ncbi:MAG: tetraacyldisaccharide 4'-kinase [Puniceicoccaceae bacterium]
MAELQDRFNEWCDECTRFLADVIYDRRQGGPAYILGGFLRGASLLFGRIVALRFWLYRHRVLRDQPLGCVVVVVGNLTVGGTGKTPVVERLAREFAARGRKVGILSRGYKSRKEPLHLRWWRWITHTPAPPPKVVSDGQTIFLGPEEAGDEPYMLAKNLPNIPVVVDKNRVKAGNFAIRRFGVDILILDDGLQYLPLKGRYNFLLVDRGNPFGNGCLLPRGILREPIRNLKRASWVLFTKSDGSRDPALESLVARHHPGVGTVECRHAPQSLRRLNGEEELPLNALAGKRVASFSGIAVPESFEKFLRDEGASIRYNRRFMDHHWFTDHELEHLFEGAQRAEVDLVVTTEKDAVRIRKDFNPRIPFYYLRLEIGIIRGEPVFQQALEKICFPERQATVPTPA